MQPAGGVSVPSVSLFRFSQNVSWYTKALQLGVAGGLDNQNIII